MVIVVLKLVCNAQDFDSMLELAFCFHQSFVLVCSEILVVSVMIHE